MRKLLSELKFILDQHGWIPIAIAAGTALAGAYASYKASKDQAEAQKQANKQNLAMAQKQMDFQAEMSNTAHRREIDDLKAAGINPLYTAGGGGASTPAGSMSVAQPISPTQNLAHGLEKGLNGAIQGYQLKQQLASNDAKLALDKAAASTQASQTQLNINNAQKAHSETLAAQANAKRTAMETTALEAKMPAIARQADLDLKRANQDLEYADHDAIMKRAATWSGTASNAMDVFSGGLGKGIKAIFGGKSKGTDRVIDSRTGEILQESRR